MTPCDAIIVGGGIVGLATARALTMVRPGMEILVLEKEQQVGQHQTGHNSGVLHSGLYYPPGSHKATLCVRGRREMLDYCDSQSIAVNVSGKLVIASRRSELDRLDQLRRNGEANGLQGLVRLGPAGISQFEPSATGLGALFVPETGVVDYGEVAVRLATTPGVEVRRSEEVVAIKPTSGSVEVATTAGHHAASVLINCAGLYSDRVARLAGLEPSIRIVPFRGEYYTLATRAAHQVRSLIYPVPDPRFPFLGVHLTRRIDSVVEVGPNAVVALGREHYRGHRPDWREGLDVLRYAGARRLARRYWRPGLAELVRSRLKPIYARSVRRLVPGIAAADLEQGGAGVRAQAVKPDGSLVDDFVFMEGPRSLHVLNAPSPAATAALAIGRTIAERATLTLGEP